MKSPQQIMEYRFKVVHNGNWRRYLNSIEWDSLWLRHDTPAESEERIRKIERENSPFAKWL